MSDETPELKDLPWTFQGVRTLVREIGLRPQKRHGQNFLSSQGLIARIVDEAELPPDSVVLEVGPGLGHLTDRLLQRGARVTAVEIDPLLAAHLHDHFETDRFNLIEGDVLAGMHSLSPRLIDWLAAQTAPVWLVANLPYAIASPLLAQLSAAPGPIVGMVVTVQREMADRLCAAPGTDAYGALTVQVGYRAVTKRLFDVPAAAFWPRPAVRSAVIRLTPGPPPNLADDEPLFRQFVRGAFHHRRKKLVNSLLNSSHFKDLLLDYAAPRPFLEQLLEQTGHPADVRAEQISVAELVTLANRLTALSGTAKKT